MHTDSLPKFYHYFAATNETRAVLITELLGNTLIDLWHQFKPFSAITVMKIGIQVVSNVQHTNSVISRV